VAADPDRPASAASRRAGRTVGPACRRRPRRPLSGADVAQLEVLALRRLEQLKRIAAGAAALRHEHTLGLVDRRPRLERALQGRPSARGLYGRREHQM
jgi:hypothetical protein